MLNKKKLYSIALVSTAMILMLVSIAGAAPFAYITNLRTNDVSVIDTATNTVTATVKVGNTPYGVACTPDGTKVYVANSGETTVSVIDTATNTVTATVKVGVSPRGIAFTPDGAKVYVTNYGDKTVSVIDTATNTVITTVNVEDGPYGVSVTPDGTKVYVANADSNTVSVIDTATNTVTDTAKVGISPRGFAVTPDGTKVYVTNFWSNTASVINTNTNTVIATVNVVDPLGVAVTPDGKKVYVTDVDSVSVIDIATDTITATVDVGLWPFGVSVTPDGTKVYVANSGETTVSVIDTATNTITATVPVGTNPSAFGQFIGPPSPLASVIPVANFSNNITSGYASLSVQFIDLSTNATTWNWDFGDGANSTQPNPTHIYSKAGIYAVNLTATNENGTDSKLSTITVLQETISHSRSSRSNSLEQNNVTTVANVEQTPEKTQSPTTSRKRSTNTPGFEAVGGIVSLLAVFLRKESKKGN